MISSPPKRASAWRSSCAASTSTSPSTISAWSPAHAHQRHFDAVVPFKFRLSDHEVEQEIQAAVKRLDSSYFAVVQIDRDYTK